MGVEEVLPGVFRIEVPLPKNPLRSINSYAIPGGERALVVDTGMARDECRAALTEGLRAAGIDPARADFFITHMHIDHLSLARELAAPGARVYLGAPDVALLRTWPGWDRLLEIAATHGFPVAEFREAIRADKTLAFDPEWIPDLTAVEGGEILAAGPRTAYEIAAGMTWELRVRAWNDWPLTQRWFATGEALSHLRCLAGRHRVRQQRVGGYEVFTYSGEP